jgi:hypothetical protein
MLYTVEYAIIFAVLVYKSNVFQVNVELSVPDPFVQLKFCKAVLLNCDKRAAVVMLEQIVLFILRTMEFLFVSGTKDIISSFLYIQCFYDLC